MAYDLTITYHNQGNPDMKSRVIVRRDSKWTKAAIQQMVDMYLSEYLSINNKHKRDDIVFEYKIEEQ